MNMNNTDEIENCQYKHWLEQCDIWRKRHGLTRKQVASIFIENDENDWRKLFWPSGQHSEFMLMILNENEN